MGARNLTIVTVLLISISSTCNRQKPRSWNPRVPGTPRIVTAAQIHDGKTFKELDGRGNSACCPPDEWKRATPNKWMAEHPDYFVQVNKLKVLTVDPGDGDECSLNGKTFHDRHVVVRSADDSIGPQFTIEFDRCWCAQNLIDCGTYPKPDQIIDVQGFVTWDGPSLSIFAPDLRPNNVSGWEIHPLTAWKLSGNGK